VGPVWYTALFGFGGYGVHIRGRNGSFLSWFVVRIYKFPRNPTGHRRSHTAQQTTQRAEDNKRTNKKEIGGIAGSIPAEKNDATTKNSREQPDQKPYPRPSDDTSNNYSGESGGEEGQINRLLTRTAIKRREDDHASLRADFIAGSTDRSKSRTPSSAASSRRHVK
jgi:hypothetical protein